MLLQEKVTFLFADLLSKNIVCGFSRRPDSNMSLCYGDTAHALDNRARFLSFYEIDFRDITCAQQVHKDKVILVKKEERGKGAVSHHEAFPDTDALITSEKNLPLALFSADCQVIFLYDTKCRAIGLAHAGWRGTKERIIGKTIQAMVEAFGTHPSSLYAGLGPAIGKCCYQVGAVFPEYFPEDVEYRNDSYYFDLKSANKRQLLEAGVREINIFSSSECTSCCDDTFFSYRREGSACGRMMSVLMLR